MQPCECLTTKEMQVATLVWSRLELALYVARQGGAAWRDTRNTPSQSASQPDPRGVLPQPG